jgi:hypothetical protein
MGKVKSFMKEMKKRGKRDMQEKIHFFAGLAISPAGFCFSRGK